MTKTIAQKVLFKNTTPQVLYSLYMDAKKHSLVTGAKAVISEKEGSKFTIYDGYSGGKTLQVVKNKLIVQSWRASDWNKTDVDSTVVFLFEQKGKDTVVHFTQVNLPANQANDLKKGWVDFYWKPWKQYLAKRV